MSVKRYDFDGIPDPCAVIGIPRKDGEYVKYSDYAALLASHNALREAVEWRKECELVRHYVLFEALETCALREITSSIFAARAEVDRLLSEEES